MSELLDSENIVTVTKNRTRQVANQAPWQFDCKSTDATRIIRTIITPGESSFLRPRLYPRFVAHLVGLVRLVMCEVAYFSTRFGARPESGTADWHHPKQSYRLRNVK